MGSSGEGFEATTLEAVVGVRKVAEDRVERVDVDVKEVAVVGVLGEGRGGCGSLSGRKRRS